MSSRSDTSSPPVDSGEATRRPSVISDGGKALDLPEKDVTELEDEKNQVAPAAATAPAPAHPKPMVAVSQQRFALIMAAIWLGNFVAYFNETTATTAQHVIAGEFNDLQAQNWMATAYLLGFTATQTILGSMTQIFGRSAVWNVTLALFAIGTLWGGLAQSMNSFIGARLLQGIGASGRQTVGVIVIIDMTTPDTRGMWLGFFNMSLSIGMAVGPILGAVLSVDTTWRWQFWLTLILVGVTILLSFTSMRNYPKGHAADWRGQLKMVDYAGCIISVGISSLICTAIEMGNKLFPWNSAQIITMFCVGGALIPVFILYELWVPKNPCVDMRLFKIWNVSIACLINFLTGAGYFGAVFALPRYFFNIKGSSLITTGVQLLGLTLAVGVSSVGGANLISKTGQIRLVGAIGGALYALGAGLMLSIARDSPAAHTIGFSVLMGLGSGILYQPSMIVGPMSVKPEQVAGISGFLSFLRTLGGTFATALLTAIYETTFENDLEGKIPSDLVHQGLELADNHAAYPQYDSQILDSFVKGFHIAFVPPIVFGIVYLVAVSLLRKIDFVPAWRRATLAKRAAATGDKA